MEWPAHPPLEGGGGVSKESSQVGADWFQLLPSDAHPIKTRCKDNVG